MPTLGITPVIYIIAPNTLMSASDKLFMKFTAGPEIVP